jgi:hypothetical protein
VDVTGNVPYKSTLHHEGGLPARAYRRSGTFAQIRLSSIGRELANDQANDVSRSTYRRLRRLRRFSTAPVDFPVAGFCCARQRPNPAGLLFFLERSGRGDPDRRYIRRNRSRTLLGLGHAAGLIVLALLIDPTIWIFLIVCVMQVYQIARGRWAEMRWSLVVACLLLLSLYEWNLALVYLGPGD